MSGTASIGSSSAEYTPASPTKCGQNQHKEPIVEREFNERGKHCSYSTAVENVLRQKSTVDSHSSDRSSKSSDFNSNAPAVTTWEPSASPSFTSTHPPDETPDFMFTRRKRVGVSITKTNACPSCSTTADSGTAKAVQRLGNRHAYLDKLTGAKYSLRIGNRGHDGDCVGFNRHFASYVKNFRGNWFIAQRWGSH